jgi:hypothetical protein
MYSAGGNESSTRICGFAGNLFQKLGIISISNPPARRASRSIAVPDKNSPKNKNKGYCPQYIFLFTQNEGSRSVKGEGKVWPGW